MYVLMYEYDVDATRHSEFERVYGSAGDWADLFRTSPGYLGTDLFRRVDETGDRYLVVDRWSSEQAFLAFKASFGAQYERFSNQTRGLYRAEVRLGAVETGRS
ncbi:antibiotic biosynthesis monooxygenase [Streptomyces sp. NBC_00879]|uniref:antibiotic biosynthesis monooxygenase family protein n=1 Tax=unclassified Streptomyces TaxID=2593676 RepID=UPI003867AB9D|nr:antibiotic biosynthesis monooxygenase [Streptomyces sp. NBC_00885]WSY73608.1 antibiotic biosynthesis monooxygenase [Streptomyces sp. NBC_00879]